MVQRLLFEKPNVTCDKLFIFDCCHAGDMINRQIQWQGACELLGACGGRAPASALLNVSFTGALLKSLKESGGDVLEIHGSLIDSRK
jgi:hypothetical protein